MDFKRGGKGVAVGKVSEVDNAFEVAEDWDVRVYGKLLKDYIQSFIKTMYPVGSIYMSVNATNPSAYFGGTWVAWGAWRVLVGINTSDSVCMGRHLRRRKCHRCRTARLFHRIKVAVGCVDAHRNPPCAHSNLQPYNVCYMWKRTA